MIRRTSCTWRRRRARCPIRSGIRAGPTPSTSIHDEIRKGQVREFSAQLSSSTPRLKLVRPNPRSHADTPRLCPAAREYPIGGHREDVIVRKGNVTTWPILQGQSIASVEIPVGKWRAPHLHTNTSEIAVIIHGSGR